MGLADWRTPDIRFVEPAAGRGRGAEDGSTIELRLYLPRRAWHFTVTCKRTDDDRDQIAAAAVS